MQQAKHAKTTSPGRFRRRAVGLALALAMSINLSAGCGLSALAAEGDDTTAETSITLSPENPTETETFTTETTPEEVQDEMVEEATDVLTGDSDIEILDSDDEEVIATLDPETKELTDPATGETPADPVIEQTGDNTYEMTAQQETDSATTTAEVTAEVTEGEATVTAEWEGTASGPDDGELTDVETLGPSDELLEDVQATATSGVMKPNEDVGRLYWIESSEDPETDTDEPITLTGNTLESAVMTGSIFYFWTDANGETHTTSSSSKAYTAQRQGYTVYTSIGKADILELEDEDGNTYYAYCADNETSTDYTAGYDIVNVYDSEQWGDDEEKAAHVSYVVTNGYWGEDNTAAEGEKASLGSLEYVRQLAAQYDSTIDASQIDDALAMTATQAAIWAYTNPDSAFNGSGQTVKKLAENGTLFMYTGYAKAAYGGLYTIASTSRVTDEQKAAATALFWALYNEGMNTEEYEDTSTDIIQEEDIQSVTISNVEKLDGDITEAKLTEMIAASLDETNKDRAAASASELVDAALENPLYTADVTMTVAVVKDRVNPDNLTVYIFAGSTLVASKQVSEATMESTEDGTGTNFTFTDVVLPSGQKITLSLVGTQEMAEGAYLYQSTVGEDSESSEEEYEEKTWTEEVWDEEKQAYVVVTKTEWVKKTTTTKETSQTLAGLIAAGGTRNVNVSVTIDFTAEGSPKAIETISEVNTVENTTPVEPTIPEYEPNGEENLYPANPVTPTTPAVQDATPEAETPVNPAVQDATPTVVPTAETPTNPAVQDARPVLPQTGAAWMEVSGLVALGLALSAGGLLPKKDKEEQ